MNAVRDLYLKETGLIAQKYMNSRGDLVVEKEYFYWLEEKIEELLRSKEKAIRED
jgi:hypothetical protein